MTTPDQQKILNDRAAPRITRLWFALCQLKSVVGFMNSGAHPDDETSGMLAALAFREGMQLSYACANRGEGGQNDIGTEATEDLGTLRTAEMERAAEVLAMRLYWLSESPEDSIFDFGFSKSGDETLGRWGAERTVRRFAEILRRERPDILCPTFLDVPGQHGHHRAMTQSAPLAIAMAADPGVDLGGLPPWQVAKLYLPAWSGAGQAYDDDLPPPPATLTIPAEPRDPVTGWSWERIGQQSRAFHRTQGMGRWVPAGDTRDWPLHLWQSAVTEGAATLFSGLPVTLADLAAHEDIPAIAAPLDAVQRAIGACLDAFPDGGAILPLAEAALIDLRAAIAALPDAAAPRVLHRLVLKERQLVALLHIAAGIEVRGSLSPAALRPGERAALRVEAHGDAVMPIVTCAPGPGFRTDGDVLIVPEDAAPSDPYPAIYDPLDPPAPRLSVALPGLGVEAVLPQAFETPPLVLPRRSAALDPPAVLVNTALPRRGFTVTPRDIAPASAAPDLAAPTGWEVTRSGARFTVTPPGDLPEGLTRLGLTLDGAPAMTLTRIGAPHVAPRLRATPAEVLVRAVPVALPKVRIGYVGGGNDRVDHWLRALGFEVIPLSDAMLSDADGLSGIDTLVVGLFALRTRPALAAALPRVHDWVAAGGTFLTLYHRPWDNWQPDASGPYRLTIGQPSLRWRVTDETAEVTHLVPDHPLLCTPNRIGPGDWEGWHKERGLYFAMDWDAAYTPLLEMADPGEDPHRGALLVADHGKGRHIHCALILHHQMEKLTPGAFRLMANLTAARE